MSRNTTVVVPPTSAQQITTTTTQLPPVPVVNPMMSLENWAPLIVFLIGVAAVIALFTKHISGRISDFKEAHAPVHDNLNKQLTDLSQRVNGELQRVTALETFRNADIERIVKLETNLHNIEKSQARIETALEKLAIDLARRIDHWAAESANSIREIREVRAKPVS